MVCSNELKDFKKIIKGSKEQIKIMKLSQKNALVNFEKIKEYEKTIQKIINEEKIEREIRMAEMETRKIDNMQRFHEEI